MSDTDERLKNIEDRLRQIELGAPGAPPPSPPNAPTMSTMPTGKPLVNLLFWLGVVVLGVVIWVLSERLK